MIVNTKEIWLIGPSLINSNTLNAYLNEEGINVRSFVKGEAVLKTPPRKTPDAILIDIDLPGADGIEICRKIKKVKSFEDALILFLTDRKENYIQIAAFNAGADDYLINPVDPRVLHSKIEALLKRVNKQIVQLSSKPEQLPLVIDQEGMTVIKDGQRIEWQNKEFELLLLFNSTPGKVYTRKELIQALWPDKEISNSRIIDVYIRRIRKKIGSHYLLTVMGKGYKFVQ